MKSLPPMLVIALIISGCNTQTSYTANSLFAHQTVASIPESGPCEYSQSYPDQLSMIRLPTDQEPEVYKDYECLNGEILDRNQPCPSLANPWCKVNWEPVDVGMLEADIKSLLGPPERVISTMPGKATWYFQSIGSISITDGKLVEFDKPDRQHYFYLKPMEPTSK